MINATMYIILAIEFAIIGFSGGFIAGFMLGTKEDRMRMKQVSDRAESADDPIPFPIQPKEERQYDAKKIFNYLKIVRSICNSCNECSKCMFWKEHELYGECILADRNPCDWEVSE